MQLAQLFNSEVLVVQSCLTLCNPMDYSLPGSSVHGMSQARILEWVAIPFSRGSSQPRGWTWVSCIAGWFFTIWASHGQRSLVGYSPWGHRVGHDWAILTFILFHRAHCKTEPLYSPFSRNFQMAFKSRLLLLQRLPFFPQGTGPFSEMFAVDKIAQVNVSAFLSLSDNVEWCSLRLWIPTQRDYWSTCCS